jgi:phenylalanyl-tRNA synthetase beta chain
VSRTYAPRAEGGVDERLHAAVLLSGKGLASAQSLGAKFCDFFDMKGLLEVYVEQFWGASLRTDGDVPALLSPGASAAVMVNGTRVGFFGEPARGVRRTWDLPGELPVFLAELDLAAPQRTDDVAVFRPLPRHPGASRDLAFVAKHSVRHEDLVREIGAAGGELLEECRLFDVYEGSPLGTDERSLAFTLVFRAPDRSLTSEEVDERVARIVERVGRTLGARIR